MNRRLRIVRDGMTAGAKVQLDGVEIGNDLVGLTVHLVPGEPPAAVLDVIIDDLSTDMETVQAVVPESTHELLVQLGWTPPEGDGAS